MFRRRPQPAPVPPAPEPLPEAVTLTSWVDAAAALARMGFGRLECPRPCRRKGEHLHLRHEAAAADLIVSPAAVERSGA